MFAMTVPVLPDFKTAECKQASKVPVHFFLSHRSLTHACLYHGKKPELACGRHLRDVEEASQVVKSTQLRPS